MKYIVNGTIVLKDGELSGCALGFDEKIREICPEADVPSDAEKIDAEGGYVLPGLIDVHIHGYLGEDVSNASSEGIRKIAAGIVKNGVTAFLPTTMTVEKEKIDASVESVRVLMDESRSWLGAQILGVHAEGPFINPKRKGAQDEKCIIPPDADWMIKNSDVIKYVTLAPEMDEGFKAIRAMTEAGIAVSMGHTDADYETAAAAVAAGVRSATHLFNAMSPLGHRSPGVVGAALTTEVYAELIADTYHVDKALFSLVAKAKGDKLIIVTDCLPAGGLPLGTYTLGGQPFVATETVCRLPDGTIAGSIMPLNRGVKNLRDNTGLPLWECVRCASLNPAEMLRIDGEKGSLEKGKDADVVIANGDLDVKKVFVLGSERYSAR
ncbi:MAG: N-acetylglucosamine-6-phosphate deacetylase [Clostridia bacterium]|nr:N-acetylglucosamine-6-phosphate deacetylase [Clostridia bacterium]